MTILVLNRFPLNLVDYPAWTHDEVVMVTARSALPANGRFDEGSYRAVHVVDDYASVATILLADRLIEAHASQALIALSEFDLLRAARLRDTHGLIGPTTAETVPYRDKLVMKQRLEAGGVPVTPFARVRHECDLLSFWNSVGGRVVLKPRCGASSEGVTVLADRSDLVRYGALNPDFGADKDSYLLAEEYVDNEMFNVDGIVVDGELRICWPSQTTSCLGFQDGNYLVAGQLTPEDPRTEPLRRITRAALDALPTPATAIFHAEVFRTPDRGYLLNEIGARIGGAKVRELLTRGFGVDPVEWYVRHVFGQSMPNAAPSDHPVKTHAYCLVPPRAGRVAQLQPGIMDRPVGVDSIELRVRAGDELRDAASSIDGMALIVAHGSTTEEAEARAVRAAQGVEGKVVFT